MIFIVRKIEYNGNKKNWQRVRDNYQILPPPENIIQTERTHQVSWRYIQH